jgi:hypothetical protein
VGDEDKELVPKKQSLFELTADDVLDSALQNLDVLDRRGGDYEIKSTFETATGTTEVQIRRSGSRTLLIAAAVLGAIILLSILIVLMAK